MLACEADPSSTGEGVQNHQLPKIFGVLSVHGGMLAGDEEGTVLSENIRLE